MEQKLTKEVSERFYNFINSDNVKIKLSKTSVLIFKGNMSNPILKIIEHSRISGLYSVCFESVKRMTNF